MTSSREPDRKSTAGSASQLSTPLVWLVLSGLCCGLTVQSLLENGSLAGQFVSPATWQTLVPSLFFGELQADLDSAGQAQIRGAIVPFWSAWLLVCLTQLLFVAAIVIASRKRTGNLADSLTRLALWWAGLGLWGILWIGCLLANLSGMLSLLQATVVFWVSLTLAGSLFELLRVLLGSQHSGTKSSGTAQSSTLWKQHAPLLLAGGLYVAVFTAMNWGLWFNLRLPHGDSAMYEEHLWNVTHGKGFRSYLDQGLFWGEHIQFAHLFLLPLYVLWPSQLLLELCESAALALGALPVFWLGRRASGSTRAGLLLGIAYLLYFPLQFLDIAIDLKTFRPIAFGVPLVLFAIDQLERRRYRTALVLLLGSLTCKEDYAIVVFSIGVVLVIDAVWPLLRRRLIRKDESPLPEPDSRAWQWGVGYLLFGPVYLLAALRLIRWFRSGVEVHYAGYFSKFGDSTSEIIWNMLTDPSLLASELLTASSLIYCLAIFVPLGLLPLRAPIKLIGCLPLLILLCLNELASDPRHHFHAPLIPLLFWATASGLKPWRKTPNDKSATTGECLAGWVLCCSLATTVWFSLSPLGVAFWDPGSAWHYRHLYLPDERARQFANVESLIPQTARVASTDYVHPRFTHYKRSYDYSNYARRVSGYALRVPADTDYIVIDTAHPYSEIKTIEQIREYQANPQQWDVLPDTTNGYYIVLKRKWKANPPADSSSQ